MGYTAHLRPSGRVEVPARSSRAAPEQPLSAADVAAFVVRGYVTVPASFGPSAAVHEVLTEQIDAALAAGAQPSNEGMLASLPNLQLVHDHPAVRGAVGRRVVQALLN